jgi:hypothetical protein
MFVKLKHPFSTPKFKTLDSHMRYGEVVDGVFMGIEYFKVDVNQQEVENLLNIIPKSYQKDFCLTLMKVNTRVPPHTDSGINVTLNYYVETGNCVTNFYRFKDTPQSYQIQNQTDGHIYSEDSVELVESFRAQSGEVYLLDVTKPHSVEPDLNFSMRTAFSLATNTYTFDEVSEMLKQTGNL